MPQPIELLGICSFIIVAWFTHKAYTSKPTPGQTPRQSILEAWINILIGFGINFVINLVMIPLATSGADISLYDNFWLGWIYTVVSMLRQYAVRRWFNKLIYKVVTKG
jgi:hypothetical protein